MTRRFSRTLLTAAAVSAFGLTALAAPAQADLAGGGNYAASVATQTIPSMGNLAGPSVRLRAKINSTSAVAGDMHGVVTIQMYRASNGNLVARRRLSVNGASGTTYKVTVDFGPGIRSANYIVTAVFEPTSGHIEKKSFGERFVTFHRG